MLNAIQTCAVFRRIIAAEYNQFLLVPQGYLSDIRHQIRERLRRILPD